ncbi:MAG: hypothetical protein R6U85_09320 [Salinivirgaceae bacterium]
MILKVEKEISYFNPLTVNNYRNYKITYKDKGFWVSEQLFSQFPGMVKFGFEKITLKEPVNHFFDVAQLINRNGMFYSLIPKNARKEDLHPAKAGKNPYINATITSFNEFFQSSGSSFLISQVYYPHVSLPNATKQNFMRAMIPFIKHADKDSQNKYLELVSREMDKFPDVEQKIMKEINKLKQTVQAIPRARKQEKQQSINLSTHAPRDLSRFLDLFRDSRGIKYLTHSYDMPNMEFSRERILSIAKEEFYNATQNLHLPAAFYNRFRKFAFGDGPGKKWFFNNKGYDLNWFAPAVIQWCKTRDGYHPITNPPFNNEMIVPFQNSYKIEAPELETLINQKLTEGLGELYTAFNIRFLDCDQASFVTDVDSLLAGLKHIFASIKQRYRNSLEIEIAYTRYPRKSVLQITHVGSESYKKLDRLTLFGSGSGGDFTEAEKYFFRVCDWSVEAPNPDGQYNKLNILFDANENIPTKEKVEEPLNGFKHILTFYH